MNTLSEVTGRSLILTHNMFDGVDNGRYCWSSTFELAGKNFLPVISGLIGATIVGVFLI